MQVEVFMLVGGTLRGPRSPRGPVHLQAVGGLGVPTAEALGGEAHARPHCGFLCLLLAGT